MASTEQDIESTSSPQQDCWNHIGVWGDNGCALLRDVIHCQNCEVFASAGRSLLERPAPDEYITEWIDALAEEKLSSDSDTVSLLVFRIGEEWLALPTSVFEEVTDVKVVRSLPHRGGTFLKGLVNIRGEIQLCVSIGELLGVDAGGVNKKALGELHHPRMVVIEKDGDRWVFPVDEVAAIRKFPLDEIHDLPVTVSRGKAAYTKGLFEWKDNKIGFLDEELLFYTLRRRVFTG